MKEMVFQLPNDLRILISEYTVEDRPRMKKVLEEMDFVKLKKIHAYKMRWAFRDIEYNVDQCHYCNSYATEFVSPPHKDELIFCSDECMDLMDDAKY